MQESLSRAFESMRDFLAAGWDAIGDGSTWTALWAMATIPRNLAFIATVGIAFVLGVMVGVLVSRPRRPAPTLEAAPPTADAAQQQPEEAPPETPLSSDLPAAALRDTLKERGLPDDAIAARVQTFVTELAATDKTLEALRSEDAETAPLVEAARRALAAGDLDSTIRHLDLARSHFGASGRTQTGRAGGLRLAAASSAVLAGNLEMSRCDYAAATRLFDQALRLLQVAETDRIIPLGKADALLQRVARIAGQAPGKDIPEVAKVASRLAFVRFATGHPDDAERLYRRALAIDEAVLGPDHPDIATDLNNLAQLSLRRNDGASAVPLLGRALAIRRQALGPAHADTLSLAQNYAGLLRRMDRVQEADQILADIALAQGQAEKVVE